MYQYKRKPILAKKETVRKNLLRASKNLSKPYSDLLYQFKESIEKDYERLRRKEISLNNLHKIWEELHDEEWEKIPKAFKKYKDAKKD